MNGRGIKIMVSGRLNGAEIARTESDMVGKIPLHTLRADIDFGIAVAYTIYGTVGVKVWDLSGRGLAGEADSSCDRGKNKQPRRRREQDERNAPVKDEAAAPVEELTHVDA